MADSEGSLYIKMAAIGAAKTAEDLAKAKRGVKELGDQAAKSGKSGHALTGAFGKLAGLVSVGAVVGGIVKATTSAASLQTQMLRLHTQAGASMGEVATQTKNVLTLAPQVGTGPQDLAQGMYHIESNGLRGAKALDALRVSAEGAKIGGANLEDVTNALGGAIASGIKGTQNYTASMGAMNAIVGAGDMNMQNLADSFGTGLLAPMKTFGVSLTDVGGALAVFGDNNIRGATAATKLTSAVRIMAAPSDAAQKKLAALGMTQYEMANEMRKPGGLVIALQDLKGHLDKLPPSARAAAVTGIFGGKQSMGVQVLLNQIDRLKAKTDDVTNGSKGFGAAWDATTHTLAFKVDQLKAHLGAVGDKIGGYLIPKLSTAAGWISKVLSPPKTTTKQVWDPTGGRGGQGEMVTRTMPEASSITEIRKALEGIERAAKSAGKWIAGAFGWFEKHKTISELVLAFAGALWLVWAALTACAAVAALIDALSAPWILVGLAIAAVIAILVVCWLKFKWFRDAVSDVIKFVVDFVKAHWKLMLSAMTFGMAALAIWVVEHFNKIVTAVKDLVKWVANAGKDIWKWITDAWTNASNWITAKWNAWVSWMQGIYKTIAKDGAAIWTWVETLWTTTWNWMTTAFGNVIKYVESLPGKIASAAKGLWDGLKTGLVDVINWLIDRFNDLPLIHGFTIFGHHVAGVPKLAHITGFAAGGPVTQSGVYDVGERGRERVFLPAGAYVQPNMSGRSTSSAGQGQPLQADVLTIFNVDGRELARAVTRANTIASSLR
jgi:TP901 family phage tail tape measure protein